MNQLATAAAIIIAAWIIGKAIGHLADIYLANRPAAPDRVVSAVSNIAATLIGAAMNTPQYISRMQALRADLDRVTTIRSESWQNQDRDRREDAKKLEKSISEALTATDLFATGYRPYIDLAFEIHRSVQKLHRDGTTFARLDSECAINSSEQIADKIVRDEKLREMARA